MIQIKKNKSISKVGKHTKASFRELSLAFVTFETHLINLIYILE